MTLIEISLIVAITIRVLQQCMGMRIMTKVLGTMPLIANKNILSMLVMLAFLATCWPARAEESVNQLSTMNIFANNGRSFASLSDAEVEALSASEKQDYDIWNKAQLELQAKQNREPANARNMQTISSDFAF